MVGGEVQAVRGGHDGAVPARRRAHAAQHRRRGDEGGLLLRAARPISRTTRCTKAWTFPTRECEQNVGDRRQETELRRGSQETEFRRQERDWQSIEGNLAGRIALVTGASRGIGRAVAVALAKAGAATSPITRFADAEAHASRSDQKQGRRAIGVPADVVRRDRGRHFESRAALWPIHILVNNAGIARQGS